MEEEGKGTGNEPHGQEDQVDEISMGRFWRGVRRVVMSWWFQRSMMMLVVCYILSSLIMITAGKYLRNN
ncbi:hypothetical protein DSO57_1013119 [Entomophthora muscae]|uniref:Uncharacterized protein n=1 Tax=Entomophthora muscae TaxID=34485 RepID=A0ACC2U436_9FUNG|nr:hypothetical protein DSO57_1013119 [Entomophthora muscae]